MNTAIGTNNADTAKAEPNAVTNGSDSGRPGDIEGFAGCKSDEDLLTRLQRDSFQFFRREYPKLRDGLFPDGTRHGSPCSIASNGFALASYAVAVERGFIERAEAIAVTLAVLRFFGEAEQSAAPDAVGYHGFFYHFLDGQTGKRTWNCELSSIDTALLVAGALVAARYYAADTPDEREIRERADALYRAVEWDWMRGDSGEPTVRMGWTPENGFLPNIWQGYNEGLLLYILALGSPTHSIDPAGFEKSVSFYEWRTLYGQEHAYAGPLFIHQMPHCYIDFRGIRDPYMRAHDSDYFENSRRATLVQQAYAIENPRGFKGYGAQFWGITASDGPGPTKATVDGREIEFYDYVARGVPDGPDDGSASPWAAVASLPFAPEIVLPTIRHFVGRQIGKYTPHGFEATINPTFPVTAPGGDTRGWVSPHNFGINQGPIVLMIENYRTDMIWRLLRMCPYIVTGLRRAGFTGGWLDRRRSAAGKSGVYVTFSDG